MVEMCVWWNGRVSYVSLLFRCHDCGYQMSYVSGRGAFRCEFTSIACLCTTLLHMHSRFGYTFVQGDINKKYY